MYIVQSSNASRRNILDRVILYAAAAAAADGGGVAVAVAAAGGVECKEEYGHKEEEKEDVEQDGTRCDSIADVCRDVFDTFVSTY